MIWAVGGIRPDAIYFVALLGRLFPIFSLLRDSLNKNLDEAINSMRAIVSEKFYR